MAESVKEPWEWPEAQWRATVEHVRAGRSLKPTEWPDGARVAVALSFDCDHAAQVTPCHLCSWPEALA